MSKSRIPISKFMTTRIKSIGPEITIKDAVKIMYENHLPSLLIKENSNIIGIVTYADIALAIAVYDSNSSSPIRDIMSSPVVSVPSDSSMLSAVELMLKKRIHKLPVIDDEKIRGIISSTDLMVLLSIFNEEQFYETFRLHLSK